MEVINVLFYTGLKLFISLIYPSYYKQLKTIVKIINS